jgi:Tfp pilus assembly protein PilN
MINLLPPALKEEYRYGARNTVLLNWVVAFVVALIGLGVLATYGLVTIQKSSNTYATQVATAQAELDRQNLKGTEKQVKEISNDFQLVVKVLSKEVLFSQLLRQIATVIPSNAVLTGLNINQTSGGIDLTAAASNYNTATQLQLNLQDPDNKIFSKADIININCGSQAAASAYPCSVQIRALFSNNNPYLFINSNKAGS